MDRLAPETRRKMLRLRKLGKQIILASNAGNQTAVMAATDRFHAAFEGAQLGRVFSALMIASGIAHAIDVDDRVIGACEHSVEDGEHCPECSAAYKQARIENGDDG